MLKMDRVLRFATSFFFMLYFFPSVLTAATVDVMIVYDSTAKSWVDSNGGMSTFAADSVARMNQATSNSNIDLTFRLVHAAEVSYTYSGDLSTDLSNLQAGTGNLSSVHELRETYGADLVALFVDTGSAYGWVGQGYRLTSYEGQPDLAFSVNAIQSVDIVHTLTHEVGHNLGCHHSKYQSTQRGPNTDLNSYSAGWYFTGTNSTQYHTIMAYDNDGYGNSYVEAPIFSSPLVNYEGQIAGDAENGDNRRTIQETMNIVAHYRSSAVDTWTRKTDLGGTGRHWAVGFSIGSKGYIGTGENLSSLRKDFWEYDSVANIWTQKADFGGTARYGAVGFSIRDKGYIGTGYDGSDTKKDFWEYDPVANTWTQKADFGGAGRDFAVGFSIGSKGYIGTGVGSSYYSDFWEYDPVANIWTQKANFEGTARYGAVGFSIGLKGYLGTGRAYSSYKSDFWEYNPAANAWTQKANFGRAIRYAVGFCIGGKGYLGTGYDLYQALRKDFWEYNPSANTWAQKADFGGTERTSASGFSMGGKGYLGMGGGYSGTTPYNDFWEYVPNDTPPAPDTDWDEDVDGSDLAKLIATFGDSNCTLQNPCAGDFNDDGVVNGGDLAIFAEEFGRTD